MTTTERIKRMKAAINEADFLGFFAESYAIGSGQWAIRIFAEYEDETKKHLFSLIGENGTHDEKTDLWAEWDKLKDSIKD